MWPGVTVEDANLRAQIAALRKALGDGRDGARYVSNVAGRGYCFVAPVTRSSARQPVPIAGITPTERVQRLPPRLTRMVGRDDTVRSLAQLLQMWRLSASSVPVVSAKPPWHPVAHTLVDGSHDAVFFIDSAALTDPQLVPTAGCVGARVDGANPDPLVGLLTFIGDRKILLVLDNCEPRDRRCGGAGRKRRQRGASRRTSWRPAAKPSWVEG